MEGENEWGQRSSLRTLNIQLKQQRIGPPTQSVGLSTIVPYTLPSPNQYGGASCLYMSSTGIMEILLNQKKGDDSPQSEGATDLSERFLMNQAAGYRLGNWRTDTILVFDRDGAAALNRDYRYTMGWYKKVNGRTLAAESDEPNATYGTSYNWIGELSGEVMRDRMALPRVNRTILHSDTEGNQWNVAEFDNRDIEKIIEALGEGHPVQLVYNHFGYWHAVIVLAYAEEDFAETDEESCPFIQRYMTEMADEPVQQRSIAKLRRAISEDGGCQKEGVFYVRDSIYQGSEDVEGIYDFDLSQTGDEAPYAKKVMKRSANWVKYLGNHAVEVSLRD